MASTLDPDNFAGGKPRGELKGHDIGSLGPSDSSDSGSDLAGSRPNADGEISLDRGADEDTDAGNAKDIGTDRVVSADEAGLGGGLDQAEEAQLGVRDNLEGSPRPNDRSDSASSEDRRRRIAEAAYYRAERRGFPLGSEDDDWLEAEKEIDGRG